MRILTAALAAALAFGLLRFALARPSIEVRFPPSALREAGRRNLAHFRQGPTVRVSSVLWAGRHHPGYLVDGRSDPTSIEKWASAPGDREPWAEVLLGGPREVDEVALELAGLREPAALTERRYRIDCFAGARLVGSLQVDGNSHASPRHAVGCPAADRVRVTFSPSDVARVYELEVWGR